MTMWPNDPILCSNFAVKLLLAFGTGLAIAALL